MRTLLLIASILLCVCFFTEKTYAQKDQTVNNGSLTSAVNFPAGNCTYNWTNSNPGIGLPASGTGNIAPFTAINNGSTPVTATITATPAPSEGYAYVPNASSNDVSVIQVSTGTVVATIQNVGTSPQYVTVSPDGSTVYVSCFGSYNIIVIDATTNKITGNINLSTNPEGVVVSPDGTKLYACNGTNVSVINTSNQQTIAQIPYGEYPFEIAVSPDGSKVYASDHYTDSVKVINTVTNTIESAFKSDQVPSGLVVSPDGKRLYVANTYGDDIWVMNTADNSLITSIPVGTGPWGEVLSPDGNTLYETNSGDAEFSGGANSNTVSVINTTTYKTTALIPVGRYPIGISITADGKKVYVANDIDDNVTVINTANNSIIGNVGVDTNPTSLGNFITPGAPCNGAPVTFTITVNPISNITAGTPNGIITACEGYESVSYQQFSVSGKNLSGDITLTAPEYFELSSTPSGSYGSSLTISPVNGSVNSVMVYVKSTASAPAGEQLGNVVLSSPKVNSQDVGVTAEITAETTPSISISASSSHICSGKSVTFTATATNGGPAPEYFWKLNSNAAGTDSPTFTSSGLNNGDVVSCSLVSNAPCTAPSNAASNSITMDVATQSSVPSVSITASANDICGGSPVTFTATPVNGGSTPAYQWQVNGQDAGTNSAAFTSSTLADGDNITCLMTSSMACSIPTTATSNTIAMAINALPVVSAGGNKAITIGSGTVLNATATGNITDITWSPGAGLSNSKILNPIASPSTTTTYTITVQNADGCTASDTATVTVIYSITVPNAFTPNGDGINDSWNIKYLDTYTNCKVQIFNRWGQLLYSSIGYTIPWDGTYKGSAVPNGTYYYIINLDKSSKPLSGFVTVVR
jgi:gliding motility-associated-like protein